MNLRSQNIDGYKYVEIYILLPMDSPQHAGTYLAYLGVIDHALCLAISVHICSSESTNMIGPKPWRVYYCPPGPVEPWRPPAVCWDLKCPPTQQGGEACQRGPYYELWGQTRHN